MMRIQDPPIYMEADYKTNSAFDSNKMRSYTKAGKFVHFVVWPTFFLHKDGPLLAKGVVQGSKLEIAGEELIYLREGDTDDENKSDDVSDDKQSNGGNAGMFTIDTNKAPIEKEGKGEDDKCPDDNKHNRENGGPSRHNSNSPIETNCSKTEDKGENGDVLEETESNPEEDKPPNDTSNASSSSQCSEDVGNGDDVPDGKQSDLDKGKSSSTSFVTKCSENKEKDVSRNSDEKGAQSDKRATDNPSFTNDKETDC